MELTRREFLGDSAALAAIASLAGGCASTKGGAAKSAKGAAGPLEDADGLATDSTMARRLYLDLVGRIPTPEESRRYEESRDPAKKENLVDSLLGSDGFADYWSMRYCDILRVKSEFPINLWPNAVYVYHRRIREFVKSDEPWDHFAAALLGAEGSNFRVAEANFLRASAKRTPEGLSEVASLTFLGKASDKFADYFRRVSYKSTREWKEEIVWVEPGDGPAPADFVHLLAGPLEDRFAAAPVERVLHWMFGEPKEGAARPDEKKLVEVFRKGGYRLKPLVRAVVLSGAYARGSVTGGFPRRRLDAEVLDDAICDITGSGRDYQSIAPEPFTFLPPDRRSILIEDGSISNAFLLLFGRPARDSGELSERDNSVTDKQRLYLFNSGKLYDRISRMTARPWFTKMKPKDRVGLLYRKFLGRAPTSAERKTVDDAKLAPRDLAWCLLNTREFLYRC
jgi:hypothetical protein